MRDLSLKVVEIPDNRGWLNTTWGVALGNTSLSYYCRYCNTIWKANFPRQTMLKPIDDADKNPCPGCIEKILVRIENHEDTAG
tara:strand:+ start:210 stop:458 length:249 start_codon:yes stop_codon:yes gene_type:complete